ncbi:MAG TPA: ribose-phosphate pyrophosphokinase [Spirochaetota bacterium]|mgnify:CR=1 FL=1|nr:ribose-phosphate pyrophosphokinase [Spirochaetota bacterium]HOM38777.1 ribose-phosphate pyrophosphokinase [Spirochaetota bacterium]HPQ49575.1 ribose-phosphate pyrophosphokinase [Spirochaetota bacterium]
MINNNISLILCNSANSFGEKIFSYLKTISDHTANIKIINTEEVWFKNGEVKTVIKEPIRGDDVYIFQLFYDPTSNRSVNDNFIALLTAIDAARQSDAGRITAVIPQFPYSRQERRKEREGITAKLASRFLEDTGADRIITIDIHAEAIAGFFDRAKLENIHASAVFIDEIKNSIDDFVVVAPDAGGVDRARFYAKKLEKGFAVIYKARDYSKVSTIEVMSLIGDVENKNTLIIDDMVDTGGTIINAAKLLKDNGAKDIHVVTTFPFLSGGGDERMANAYREGIIKSFITTDCVNREKDFLDKNPWYKSVSVSALFAKVIYNINKNISISKILE